jgi:hypothetical protein
MLANGEITEKNNFSTEVNSGTAAEPAKFSETLRLTLPLAQSDKPAIDSLVIGFQLTPEQLRLNRGDAPATPQKSAN